MKDVKDNSVQWTDWDSDRECLKFNKVGKHLSSTKIITANNYQCIISGKCTAKQFTLKYITLACQILQAKQVYPRD